ncbi:MAG: helix-turn-helix transcriptional regulator [Acidobacteriota bacterium]
MAPPRDRALHTFARNVLRQREAEGLSQYQLAEKADLDRTYISGIERGVSKLRALHRKRLTLPHSQHLRVSFVFLNGFPITPQPFLYVSHV